MGTAIPKDAQGVKKAAPMVRATVIDVLRDQVTIRIPLSDELAGAIVRGKADHIIASFTGAEARKILGPVRAVKA